MDEEKFKALLDDQHDFPSPYTFKFIVKKDNVAAVKALFHEQMVQTKPSKEGNYISVTARPTMISSDDVMAIYRKAYQIEGVISL